MASLFDRLKTSIYPIVAAWVDDSGGQQITTPSTPLPVALGGVQSASTNNTTTTPLASGGTYQGVGESSALPEIACSCYSDSPGTLYFQFRNPGSSLWHTYPTTGYEVLANVHEVHSVVKFGRDARVKFVNSSNPQTTLEIFTYFGASFDVRTPARALEEAAVLTITAGATHQNVFPANGARGSLGFSNTSDTAMSCRFGDNAAALIGVYCAPNGGGFILEDVACPITSVDVICATIGKTFYAWQT